MNGIIDNSDLFSELEKQGIKYNREDVVFIAGDETGQIVWLETGNSVSGLKHIIQRHSKDFKRVLGLD